MLNICVKCGATMTQGVAIEETYTGMGDFHANDYVCTMSVGGPGKLVNCEKCPDCGYSVSCGELK